MKYAKTFKTTDEKEEYVSEHSTREYMPLVSLTKDNWKININQIKKS